MKSSFDRKDRLERFVRDNRTEFESEEPDDQLWNRIEARLHPEAPAHKKSSASQNRWRRQISYDWRVAATVLVLFTLGLFTYVNNRYGLSRDPEMALQAPTFAREVSEYTRVINERRSELKKLTANKPDLYRDFAAELDRLEMAYTGLRSELPESPDPETHLHAMVQNLQWQVNLLNQQITIIEKIKKANEKKNSDDGLMAI